MTISVCSKEENNWPVYFFPYLNVNMFALSVECCFNMSPKRNVAVFLMLHKDTKAADRIRIQKHNDK